MENKRSEHYDWFQGKNPGGKKDPKSAWKTAWKFTRIFLYLSLFVFTMTGCVQILIVKTDTKIGRGVEFYADKNDVPPHLTHFVIGKGSTSAGQNSTKVSDIYSLTVDSKVSAWVKDKKQLQWFRKELNNQTIHNHEYLSDAYRGGNEAFIITGSALLDSEKTPAGYAHAPFGNAGEPYFISTLSDKLVPAGKSLSLKTAGFKDFYLGSEKDPITYNVHPGGLVAHTVAQQYGLNVIKEILSRRLSGGTSLTLGAWINNQIGINNMDINSTAYAYKKVIANPLIKPGLSNVQRQQIQGAFTIVDTLFQYVGINTQIAPGKIISDVKLSFSRDFVPGLGNKFSDSNYRPLSSWGKAWELGPFYGIFVYPIATLAAKMIEGMGDLNGWETLITIFIVVWVIRALTFGLSFKSTMQQTKMQELSGRKAIIDAKYINYKGNKQMEQKQKQEVSELYKKEGINPLGSLGTMFLTMPFFLAMWRVIGAIPHIKSTVWAGINFSATSYKEVLTWDGWQYVPLIILAVIFAVGQQLVPRLLTKKRDKSRINVHQKAAMKKNNKMQNIMMIVFGGMAVIFSAGMQIYWIAGGMWMIVQSYATHRFFLYQHKKKRRG